jgi:hypothetical protein
MRRYPKHLGHLACQRCGRERCEDYETASSWLIVVRLGVLATVLCPRCRR